VTNKLQGTCSVCLRVMQLRGDRPIRHGFSAIGVRHGTSGGYHTGPCGGSGFPNLSISTEGTEWALERARRNLATVRDELAKLATNPDLVYFPKKYDVRGGRPDMTRPITLHYGDDVDTRPETAHPSYEYEHRQRQSKLEAHEAELERTIATYEEVIATWSSAKYPVTSAAGKVETTHMAMPRKNSRGETWTGVLCRSTRPGYASDKIAKTTDPSEVTCKRCRAALGLPPT
jgi:hypothetical protein